MMPPRIEGFRTCQSRSAALVTVMKSDPKKTRSTPSMANSRLASGDGAPASADAKSIVPLSMTTRPGRNFRVDGLGVCSVWMNKPTSLSSARGLAAGAAQAGDGTSPPPFDGSDLGTTALGIKPILEQLWKILWEIWILLLIFRGIFDCVIAAAEFRVAYTKEGSHRRAAKWSQGLRRSRRSPPRSMRRVRW